MKHIQLVPLGEVSGHVLQVLGAQLAEQFQARCNILPTAPLPTFAFNPNRGQYCSTEILAQMAASVDSSTWRALAVAGFDLYIPILTFVFGEAQLAGPCALVSIHRLRQEAYGFPPDHKLLQERLRKEAVHELGHTLGLTHCAEGNCVMASSHAVEWIDLKSADFCPSCRARARDSVIPQVSLGPG